MAAIGHILSGYLDEMVKQGASDMYLTVGCKPSMRKNNNIITIGDSILQPKDIKLFLDTLLNEEKRNDFAANMELNFSIIREDGSRYRINFLRQQENTAMVIRRINMIIPTLEELGLPDIYGKTIMRKRGLVILASPGGSGKSTSMAAMLGHRNKHGSGHIITVEDPIEFIHKHDKCIFTQREVGTDTLSYAMALKNALRQRADVIAVGEIRDRESLSHAIRFAETGHLCVATLHSNNSSQAITRMVNLFPDEAKQYIVATLSQNLIAVFSQRIVPNLSNGQNVATEIMLNEGLIKALIADNKLVEIRAAIERGEDAGMLTLDNSLFKLYEAGKISAEIALAEAENPGTLKVKIAQRNAGMPGFQGTMQKDIIDKNVF